MAYTLKGYQVLEKLYDGPQTLVYRGRRQTDQQSVIIKVPKNPYPTLAELAQLRHQYAILQRLNLSGVLKAYSLEQSQQRIALILEDYGGISLYEFIAAQADKDHSTYPSTKKDIAQCISLDTFFSIALQLAEILEGLYRYKVTHKDIKPENILIHPTTLEVKLIDFSIASCLTKERQGAQQPEMLQGTLAYMSPEQTGRMNRGIDYRTDFYSLGVTFYKLLTGHLPFQALTPLELIHEHIAGIPTSPNQLNSELPLALNQVVLKLMAKVPEDRYQTAYGLQADLFHCQSLWAEGKHLVSFELGAQDISDRFAISEKLYGREQEIKTLISTFDRVAQGSAEIIFVSGLSGIGKTTVVQEIHKPIARQGGYFSCGKFDQLQNNSPLSGLVQAFSSLIQQLLTENDQNIKVWRSKILEVLGDNGQVLVEVLPELELLIGKQPPVSDLEPIAAQNRFNFLFQRFIQVFPDKAHPLVLFLDDLQWADFASLQLIQSLMTQQVTPYILIIGAYRSEEVSSAHPLQLTINEITTSGTTVGSINLAPFQIKDLTHLVSDTLNCSLDSAAPLARTVYQASQGNPFFSVQLLKSFYQEGLITFNWTERLWQWDLFEVQAMSLTNNIVEFVALQIQKLSPVAQEILYIAACKGNTFSDVLLEHVLDISLTDLHSGLWETLQAGLIVSDNTVYALYQVNELTLQSQSNSVDKISSADSLLDANKCNYRFTHDRVQQAAYSLVSQDKKKAIHHKIGYYLLKKVYTSIQREELLFEIVNHLNLGIDYIESSVEKVKLSQFNWLAGCKAKKSTAYLDALEYFIHGIKILGPNSWRIEYELTLGLHIGAAQSTLLIGSYEQMETFVQAIETYAQNDLDRIKALQVKVEAYKAQGQLRNAITTGLSALDILGISLPERPQPLDIQNQFDETQLALGNRIIEDLENLSIMTSPKQLVIMSLLGQLLPITYSYNPLLCSVLILTSIQLSIKKGNSPITAWAYIAYGVLIWKTLDDIDNVRKFGKLGEKLGHKFNIKKHLATVNFAFNIFIQYWEVALRETLRPLLNNYLLSLEVGDLVHASFSLVDYVEHSLWCGKPLNILEQELSRYYENLLKLNQEISRSFYEIYWQATLNLTNVSQDSTILSGEITEESVMLPYFQKIGNRQAIFLFFLYKQYLCYLFHNYSEALQNSSLAQIYLDSVPCRVVVVVFHFYRLLSFLATCADKTPTEQDSILEIVTQQSDQLRKWADSAPMNFLHKYCLVEAERHRVLGQYVEAMAAYDQAISLAQENEYLNEEALAYELAGQFYLGWGKTMIAQTYLINAYYTYERWGAKAKLRDLEQRYPDLLSLFQKTEPHLHLSTLTTFSEATSISSKTNRLDWVSVMRASQALSQEIDLDKLLKTIMEVVIENAGAEQGSLLLLEEEALVLKAYCIMEASKTNKCELFYNQTQWFQKLPTSVINYVNRTQQALVLANATTEARFAADPYMVTYQPRSVLCMPIQRQGERVGILYLENNLTTEAFTTERLEVLQILIAQAAISLENAQLYASVEQKVRSRTSELQAAKQEAEHAKELSEKANLAKSEFLANMSHELRTPLNAVLGFSQLLYRDPSISPDQQKKLSIINRSGEHLLTLINDVLTMSKIESGRTTLHETSFDLQALLLSIHEMLLMKATAKNLKFDVECSQELPQFIQTDEGKLRQVLINLLGNAIKFTQQGSVKLRVSLNSMEHEAAQSNAIGQPVASLNFEVEDTGSGIAPHEMDALFEAFAQTAIGRQSQEGTGLGLPISRTFIQLMGGDIRVKSTLGQGSCFSFNIRVFLLDQVPINAPASLGNVIGLAPDQLAYRILVVEDRWENQQVLVQLLETVGFEVEVASNGEEAIAAWQTSPPHLICMDLQMPVMDGYEAAQVIQHQAAQAQLQPPVIIAVTANTFEETQLETVEIGFDDFIYKPFQAEELLETIAKHLGVRYLRAASSPVHGLGLQPELGSQFITLTSEDLHSLPPEWMNQVYLAASELDEPRLAALIDQVQEQYPVIAKALMNLAENLEFEQVINLVQTDLVL